jgi:hypothetical protein
VGVVAPRSGLYSISTAAFGTSNLRAVSNFFFQGDFYMSGYIQLYTTPNTSGTLIASIPLGYMNAIEIGGEEEYFNFVNYGISVNLTAGVRYYAHTLINTYGYGNAGIITVYNNVNPTAQNLQTSFSQVEIGQNGIVAIADANNYVKIERYQIGSGISNTPIIDIKTDRPLTPGLRITNTDATGRAIEVLDGDIYLSGTGNNFRVAGGWIGTDNTNSGGIRMGLNQVGGGAESCLIGSNFPGQNTNVAAARLRIASPNTKLGITGRELIFDTGSTLRIKRAIEPYPDSAYDTIKKMRPVLFTPLNIINTLTFETNGDEDYSKTYPMPNAKEYIGKMGGFVAEWFDEDPDLRKYVVYGQSNGKVQTDTIAYDKLVIPLTKAVQMLMDKVEALEAYISSSKI